MNGKFLLDTNIVIAFLKQDQEINKIIEQLEEVYIPVTVIGELYYGAFNSKHVENNLKKISSFLNIVPALESNDGTARVYGEIKSALKKKGKPIPENDIWIAAVAKQYGLTVITRDLHFKEIEDLEIHYPLENSTP